MLPSYPLEKKLNNISTVDVEQCNHPVVIVVSPLNALDQIDVKNMRMPLEKRIAFSNKATAVSEEKLDEDKYHIRATQCACRQFSSNRRPGPASQYRMEVSNMFTEYFNLCS